MKSLARASTAFIGAALALLIASPQLSRRATLAQSATTAQSAKRPAKPYTMQLLYTGPDGQAYVKTIHAAARPNGVVDLLPTSGIEIHRTPPGFSIGWHLERRRQYLITLSGRGEIGIAGGKTIILTPGSILLVENTTGKGHQTRTLGNKPWVTLWIPLKDQSPSPSP
ncbi:MAG: cupin domain-containing protein [Acidobacteriota bacterium]|nr:cupin domain-containing protein [Acidobacteriota bacterium]